MGKINMCKRCVIVDDVRASREKVSTWLTRQGFECVIAADGNEAWRQIQSNPPHLILTDISMPNCCGLELLKRVRQSDSSEIKTIPVLVITSLHDGQLAETIQQFGGNALIAKPLDMQSTLSIVTAVLASDSPTIELIVHDPENRNIGDGQVSPTFRRHVGNEINW
ncbi:CAI-1 autoinducer sensor kinase/phosphatase CqsS [Roseimaritima multifibrata]|uniref:CAI-1 autoinducer sensor kinase/phosphatase CqsS n=1 Tax=Roseimaritima multifibrata TaxID=1930274 RepID=A0A517MD59_9BACT|nr:response regulator [Roseimaritima multifibrata]QDS92821.1 CAI-1 autoinducer sensor kinase/phosphatase CqsS [Roseimaritima multifibrata]